MLSNLDAACAMALHGLLAGGGLWSNNIPTKTDKAVNSLTEV